MEAEPDELAYGKTEGGYFYAASADLMVHGIAAARDVPALENLRHVDQLPATCDGGRAADESPAAQAA